LRKPPRRLASFHCQCNHAILWIYGFEERLRISCNFAVRISGDYRMLSLRYIRYNPRLKYRFRHHTLVSGSNFGLPFALRLDTTYHWLTFDFRGVLIPGFTLNLEMQLCTTHPLPVSAFWLQPPGSHDPRLPADGLCFNFRSAIRKGDTFRTPWSDVVLSFGFCLDSRGERYKSARYTTNVDSRAESSFFETGPRSID
jgi:hypothetical protein